MVDFYISAIKMDSAGQHIEFVKVHKINRDGSWNTAGSISSRKFISELISMGKASFMTVVKNSSTGKWNLGGVSLDIENYCTVSLFFEQTYL